MAAITVHETIYSQLKQAYIEKFGGSPSRMIAELNAVYEHELEILRNRKRASKVQDLISDKTLRNFFGATQPVSMNQQNLNYLCNVLLNYKSYQDALRQLEQPRAEERLGSENWFEEYQEKLQSNYQKRIEEKCGQIQVLDMNEPKRAEDVYAQVKITEDIKSHKQRTIDQLIYGLSEPGEPEDSPSLKRLGMSPKVHRVSGLEVASKHPRLVVLGNAGSGKTTFLKHLAMNFPSESHGKPVVPVFIGLNKFAEENSQENLIQAIEQEFEFSPNISEIVQGLLKQGHCLILLDGLDEVPDRESDRVYKSIDEMVDKYPDNRFIITGRIGTREYQFTGFKQVEMAEFDPEQMEEFVRNWFRDAREPDLEKKFLAQIHENPSVKELATSPLLLTILCWTFEYGYDLPKNRCSLYDDIVQALSRRWDANRRITRDVVYPELTRPRIIKMLSEIAYSAFAQNPKRFYWQRWTLETQISNFVREIPGIQTAISLDSITTQSSYDTSLRTEDYRSDAILKMLQTNLGLLVAQSKDIYTFSHLSFQEFFTGCYILDRPELLSVVIEHHLTDRQWREVFLIIAGRLADGNELLKQMFYYADSLICDRQPIQRMLGWLNRVTTTAKAASSSWRMFWLTVDFDIDLYIDNDIAIDRILAQKLSTKMRAFNEARGKLVPRSPECKTRIYLAVIHALVNEYALGEKGKAREFDAFHREKLEIEKNYNIRTKLEDTLKTVQSTGDEDLANELRALEQSLPNVKDPTGDWQAWQGDLQRLMLKHLDIGHEVKFDPDDVQALEDYLYVLDLILDCMQADSSTSRALREDLVDHLLLPSKIIPPKLFPTSNH